MIRPQAAVGGLAEALAERLASPTQVRGLDLPSGWWPQSLARGAAGIALLHIERARAGLGSWQLAHQWLAYAADGIVTGGEDSHLYYGAPALAFALHTAAAVRPGDYSRALATLDIHVQAITRRRLAAAHARIDAGHLPVLAEYDAIRGLTGLGALLRYRDPGGDLIRQVLAYLVRLTEPILHQGDRLPGWWTDSSPNGQPSPHYPGGHANHGVAHGIGGPLALLALTHRQQVTVEGQVDAIGRMCRWLDRWRQDTSTGSWWPYWITRAELDTGRTTMRRPGRPSWCYGTAGVGRAQQLAAIATADRARQHMAEHALTAALTDPSQRAAMDLSLCHGYAGLVHIVAHAARDAITAPLAAGFPHLLDTIANDATSRDTLPARLLQPGAGDAGLLEGAAGIALALHTAHTGVPPDPAWDACLLMA